MTYLAIGFFALLGRKFTETLKCTPLCKLLYYIIYNTAGGIVRDLCILNTIPSILSDKISILVLCFVWYIPLSWVVYVLNFLEKYRLIVFMEAISLHEFLLVGINACTNNMHVFVRVLAMIVTATLGGLIFQLLTSQKLRIKDIFSTYRLASIIISLLLIIIPTSVNSLVLLICLFLYIEHHK